MSVESTVSCELAADSTLSCSQMWVSGSRLAQLLRSHLTSVPPPLSHITLLYRVTSSCWKERARSTDCLGLREGFSFKPDLKDWAPCKVSRPKGGGVQIGSVSGQYFKILYVWACTGGGGRLPGSLTKIQLLEIYKCIHRYRMLVESIDNNIVVRAEHLSIYYEIRFDKIKYHNAVLRV